MLIDRTRSTLHPGDTKKVRKTNWEGNQMPEQGDRFISYPSIKMEPRRYLVTIHESTWGYDEEYTIKSTLSGIEAWIRTEYGDSIEVVKIEQVREPANVLDLTLDS